MRSFNNEEVQDLAIRLVHADTEDAVAKILQTKGLWDDHTLWRLVGDDLNNFAIIGSQQARSEPALVEKLVNAVDARLMGACIRAGIDPTSPAAPQTILDARNQFFPSKDRSELARDITVAITGARSQQHGMPCITICDTGEGQVPTKVPDTFMSIHRDNKLRIPFVQGKFNMGGTGALMFCGKKKLQLLITRRDPEILRLTGSREATDRRWSVTVVRRETPPEGPGHVRNPYYRYLAPINSDTGSGEVLTFDADSLTIMPEGKTPYARSMQWGSCVKLYEYDMRGFKGHILRKGGLLPRIEILLPEIALPIRAYECRPGFRGHEGSFDTNLIGLRARLEASRGDNLEPGYPASLSLNVQGESMTARIYAFKGDNADSYRADQGVVFTINGQTHGSFPKSFFERKRVKMGRLAKSLLIVVDCTEISVNTRADFFKNNRDRLSGGDFRRDVEEELETQISSHPGLRELREKRRHQEVTERLSNSKPLEDVLKAIIKSSPSLSRLFLAGQRLSSPYRAGQEGNLVDGAGTETGVAEFKPRPHPSFFRFEKLKDGDQISRSCEHGRRCRLKFVTDVENEYFTREINRGRYHVEVVAGALEGDELTNSMNLFNGLVNWSVVIPEEDVAPGDTLTLQFVVDDDVLLEPFINIATITVTEKQPREGGIRPPKPKRSQGNQDDATGTSSQNGKSGDKGDGPPIGITLPPIHKVRKEGWKERGFDEHSGCTVIDTGTGNEDDDRSSYEFFVNVDNIYLQTDMKSRDVDPAVVEAKFIYGNVLVSLALVHDEQQMTRKPREDAESEQDEEPIARAIERTTRALSPFLVPMIDYLGGLDSVDAVELAQTGDEE